MRLFILLLVLVIPPLQAQERPPSWAIRYSPLHLAYLDPTIQFQFEKFLTPQTSWTTSLGIGHHILFPNRDIQGTIQGKVGIKKYLTPFQGGKKNNFYIGFEGMYKYTLEDKHAFIRDNSGEIAHFKLQVHGLAGHAMVGWTLMNPDAPSLDFYVGLGIRHLQNRNKGLSSSQPWEEPLTQYNRTAGNFTSLSPLLGLCIGIGHWKNK